MKDQRFPLLAPTALLLFSFACSSVAGVFDGTTTSTAATGTPAIDSGSTTGGGGQQDPERDPESEDRPGDEPQPLQAGADPCLIGTWTLDLEVFLENMRGFATGMPGEIADASGEQILELRADGAAVSDLDLTITLCAPTGDCGPINWSSSGESSYSADPESGILTAEGGSLMSANLFGVKESERITEPQAVQYICEGDTLTLQAEDGPTHVFHRVEQ